MATLRTVLYQLKLKKAEQLLKPGHHRDTLEACLPSWTAFLDLAQRLLPSSAHTGHVGMKLTREPAARSPFQEGGPDGWLK